MFAERLKKLRKEKNITQIDFAQQFNIATGTIGMWETGKRQPDLSTIERIANYFDVTVDYLLGREEKPSENSNDLSTKIMELFNRLDEKHQQQVIEYTRFVLSLDDDEQN